MNWYMVISCVQNVRETATVSHITINITANQRCKYTISVNIPNKFVVVVVVVFKREREVTVAYSESHTTRAQ